MKKSLLFASLLFSLILCNSLVSALSVGFSPSALIFNTNKDQTSCKDIYFWGDQYKVLTSDKWALNKYVAWNPNLFKTSASSLGVTINYPSEVSSNVGKVRVCVSGKNPGEYHGIVLLKGVPQSNNQCPTGNICAQTIAQMGIWVKLVVK